jgi:formiminoglutamase
VGVERNGGRNGARFAPKSFLSYFKKLNLTPTTAQHFFQEVEVASEALERIDFQLAQHEESQQISQILKKWPVPFCHIGGGHDHIYSLLKALSLQTKKIIVINVDAHADTRTDEDFHSGTPFRQFSQEYQGDFHLFQIGLHPFANSASTLTPLSKGKMHLFWRKDLSNSEKLTTFFAHISQLIDPDTKVIFSLDADAMTGSEVPGVSAVNGEGLTRAELSLLWSFYQKLPLPHSSILGIYELNPLYDSLSMQSMRVLGSFVFETIK